MFDWFIGATPEGVLSTSTGVLDRYEANADATVWTFTLKRGITWQDGEEMTAEDIKFTVEYYGRAEAVCTACGFIKATVQRVESVDRYTARLHLKKPDVTVAAVFGPLEGDLVILPKHYLTRVGPKEFAEKPLGSGPWRFVTRKIGQFIEYEAHTAYWDPARIPGFAKLRVLLVPENRTRLAMLRRGEVDLIPVEPQDVEVLKKEGFKLLGPRNADSTTLIFWKSYDPTFLTHTLELRKAMALAVDWDALFRAFYPPEVAERYRGGGALFTPLNAGHDASLPPYHYDPVEAKRLLRQAGYRGEVVTFWSFASFENPEQKEVNEVIAGYWRTIGMQVELVPIDFASFVPTYASDPQKFDPPIVVGVMSPVSRPSTLGNIRTFMMSHQAGGRIWGYWHPDKIDRYYAEISALVDDAQRHRRLQDLNRELYEEYWAVPITLRHFPFAASAKIASWQPSNGVPFNLAFETLRPQK
jgi:peptide/nickel transport system substrate-binding protein